YNRGTFYTYFSDVYEMQDILKKSLIPEKDMILDPLMSLERSGGRVFDSFEKTNVYMRENKEKIAVMIGPEGDPSFVHDFKMEIRKIIMSYVNSIGIKEARKFEYIIEYQISALIGIFQLWVEKNEDMDEYELARMMEVVSHNGVTSMMESMLNDKYK
ncbi:MAG TPA: TetR family transcriptional regulator C-terminal domain-containing protein, partial [Candidatus Salinicoccus merdavium]|nr:TetR family transcriptional regulator C-terminal domain-containing protein [Candidatus Salinicoccus merdavium]